MAAPSGGGGASFGSLSAGRRYGTVLGLAVFVGASFLAPFAYMERQRQAGVRLMDREQALGRQDIMRGPYLNTGSRDVGADDTYLKKQRAQRNP
jgi:hypothetical protein